MKIGDAKGGGYPPTWLAAILMAVLVACILALPLLLAGCSVNLPTTCQGGQVCAGPYLIEW
jgi:hypothetical protein